jgi:putative MATE family efflux protein
LSTEVDLLDRRTRQITEGSIALALLRLVGPVMVSVTLQTSYQLVNTFWVGRLGAAAVAAISVTAPLTFFLIVLGSGLSIAGSIFVAQHSGAREYHRVNHVAAQTIVMVACVALGLSVIGIVSARPVLGLIGVAPDVLPSAASYLHITYAGLLFSYGFMMFQSILQGVGEVRFPLYVVASSVVMNALLDPLLIFGWGPIAAQGVVGAAIATVISQGFAALVGVGILFTGRYGVKVRAHHFVPDFAFIKRALAVGLPASIEQGTRTFGSVVLTALAAGFGTHALAAYGVGGRIITFFFVPALGLSSATATVVGQNIGAGKIDRAERAIALSGWLAFGSVTVLGAIFYPFADDVVRFLVPSDERVVALATQFAHVTAPVFGVITAQQAMAGGFRGAGQTTTAMMIAILMQWCCQVPVSYYLAHYTTLGVAGVWWGFPIANILALALSIYLFRRGKWKYERLTMDARLAARVAEEAQVEEGVP